MNSRLAAIKLAWLPLALAPFAVVGMMLMLSSPSLADESDSASHAAEHEHEHGGGDHEGDEHGHDNHGHGDHDHGDGDHGHGGHGHHDPYDLSHGNASNSLEDPSVFKSDLAIWTFVVFLLLMAILYKFAWGPIVAGLEKREKSIADHIEEAKRINEEAQKISADYEGKLANAADEVREMLDEARRDAESTKQRIVAEAQDAAQAEKERAIREIQLAKSDALHEISNSSVNAAIDLAGQVVKRELKRFRPHRIDPGRIGEVS